MAANFFEREDSRHGLAKRVIEFRYLQQKIASALNTEEPCFGYNFTYFDAFCGTGIYPVPQAEQQPAHCPFPPEYGSPLVALHTLEQIFNGRYNKSYPRTALFVFEDADPKYIEELKGNVLNRILIDVDILGNANNTWNYIRTKANNVMLTVTIMFIVGEFRNLNPAMLIEQNAFNLCTPMTSFIDPFGFSHTPMDQVISFLGERRDIILFFGVESINRFQGVLEQGHNMTQLMGTTNWRQFLPLNHTLLESPQKMKAYVSVYQTCSNLKCRERGMGQARTCHISMRRGTAAGPDKRFIYDLIFISLDLRLLDRMKYAMGVGSQNNKEALNHFGRDLYFSDFHYDVNAIWAPLSSRPNEAEIIKHAWSGRSCTFGQLKEWILTETPLQIHSRVFQDLERNGILTVTNAQYRTKVFVPAVPAAPPVVNEVVNRETVAPTVENVPTPAGVMPVASTAIVGVPTHVQSVVNVPVSTSTEVIESRTDPRIRKPFPKYVGKLSTDPDEDEIKREGYKYRNDWMLQFTLCNCLSCSMNRKAKIQ